MGDRRAACRSHSGFAWCDEFCAHRVKFFSGVPQWTMRCHRLPLGVNVVNSQGGGVTSSSSSTTTQRFGRVFIHDSPRYFDLRASASIAPGSLPVNAKQRATLLRRVCQLFFTFCSLLPGSRFAMTAHCATQ